MATVAGLMAYLKTLDPEQGVMALVLTRKDFNEYVIQGNCPDVPSEELWRHYTSEPEMSEFDRTVVGENLIDYLGDMLYEDWANYVEEFGIMSEESE